MDLRILFAGTRCPIIKEKMPEVIKKLFRIKTEMIGNNSWLYQ